jgi:DNA mismatch repair ATPase MutS
MRIVGPDKISKDALRHLIYASGRRERYDTSKLEEWFDAPLVNVHDIKKVHEAVQELRKIRGQRIYGEGDPASNVSEWREEWTGLFHSLRAVFNENGILDQSEKMLFKNMVNSINRELKEYEGHKDHVSSEYIKLLYGSLADLGRVLEGDKSRIACQTDLVAFGRFITALNQIVNHIDALLCIESFMEMSSRYELSTEWAFPELTDNSPPFIEIHRGENPVLSVIQLFSSQHLPLKKTGRRVQPISLSLGHIAGNKSRILGTILTGPNEYGKTTVLDTITLMTILGQMGAPLPAEQVRLAPFANLAVLSREGNQSLQGGISSFAGELKQWAPVHPDRQTLLLYDEPNTSTDPDPGRALFLATCEELLLPSQAVWAIATHYRRGLRRFAKEHPQVQMLQVGKSFDPEHPDRKKDYAISPGVFHDSYTFAVAAKYLPKKVITRAKGYL